MNEIKTIDIINKYNLGTILKKLNIKVMYGETFEAHVRSGILYIKETIDEDAVEIFKIVAPSVNRLHGTELDENDIEEMCVFVILHEVGHIVDYRESKHEIAYLIHYNILSKRAERKAKRQARKAQMIQKIMNKLSDMYCEVLDDIWFRVDFYLEKALDKAVMKFYDIYRCIPHEEIADKFAIRNVYEVLQGTGKIYC